MHVHEEVGGAMPNDDGPGLFRVTLLVECSGLEEAGLLAEQVGGVACGDPQSVSDPSHVCAHGWMTMVSRLSEDEASEWVEDLNR
jgi:hypothetical protein